MRRRPLIVLAASLVLAAAAVGGFLVWALTPYPPGEAASVALENGDGVAVTRSGDAIVFTPTDDSPRVGLVLYPGARVDAAAYAPLARRVASFGYLVAVTPMKLNLAILSPDRADRVRARHPEIVAWAVGGHSLGGVVAADYAEDPAIRGLVLLAAYPQAKRDLSKRGDLVAVSIYGTRDGLLDGAKLQESVRRLPRGPESGTATSWVDSEFVAIEGGNHAQFGDYGPQRGDLPAAITPEEQQRQTAEAIARMLMPLRRKAQ